MNYRFLTDFGNKLNDIAQKTKCNWWAWCLLRIEQELRGLRFRLWLMKTDTRRPVEQPSRIMVDLHQRFQ